MKKKVFEVIVHCATTCTHIYLLLLLLITIFSHFLVHYAIPAEFATSTYLFIYTRSSYSAPSICAHLGLALMDKVFKKIQTVLILGLALIIFEYFFDKTVFPQLYFHNCSSTIVVSLNCISQIVVSLIVFPQLWNFMNFALFL